MLRGGLTFMEQRELVYGLRFVSLADDERRGRERRATRARRRRFGIWGVLRGPILCAVCRELLEPWQRKGAVANTMGGWEKTDHHVGFSITIGMRGVDVQPAHYGCAWEHRRARRAGKVVSLGTRRIRRG